jgi:hypothetical protein
MSMTLHVVRSLFCQLPVQEERSLTLSHCSRWSFEIGEVSPEFQEELQYRIWEGTAFKVSCDFLCQLNLYWTPILPVCCLPRQPKAQPVCRWGGQSQLVWVGGLCSVSVSSCSWEPQAHVGKFFPEQRMCKTAGACYCIISKIYWLRQVT